MERNRLKELIQNQVEIKEALKEMWHNEDGEYKEAEYFHLFKKSLDVLCSLRMQLEDMEV